MLLQKTLFHPRFIGLYHFIYSRQIKYLVDDLGMIPNWWPGYNSGYPIILTLDGFLNPIIVLTLKFLQPFFANSLLILIFFTINGVSAYAFARAIKLSKVASLISSIAYAFSGVVMRYMAVTGIVAVMPFLPLSFLFCLKIIQGNKKWFWGWLLLLVYSWIGGWSEMMVYALVAVTFFAIYLAVKQKRSGNFSYYPMFLFFGAIIISIILLLPWFLSVIYFVSLSERASGISIDNAGYMPFNLSRLLHMFHPLINIFYGELLPIVPIVGQDVFTFIGFLPILLVILTLLIRKKREKEYLIFFLLLAALSILMTINNSPLFWLFHQLPVLKWFGGYWKWSFVIVFSLSILAGYGMDSIKDFFMERLRKYFLIILWTVMIITTIGIAAVTIFDDMIKSKITAYGVSNYRKTSDRIFTQPDGYYSKVIGKIADTLVESFSLKNKWVSVTLLLWLLTIVYITLGKYQIMPHQKWRITGVVITFLSSVFIWYGYFDGPGISYLLSSPETAKFMHSIEPYNSRSLPINEQTYNVLKPYRIYQYLPDQYVSVLSQKYNVHLADAKTRLWFSHEMMDDNLHFAFDFDSFVNHQALSLRRLSDLYYLTRQQKPFTKESYKETTPFEKYLEDFSGEKNAKILGMLNVKYIITPFELKENFKKIFTTNTKQDNIQIHVYENPYFLERWYFADAIKFVDSKNDTALESLKNIEDFARTTLIESNASSDKAIVLSHDPTDSFKVIKYGVGNFKIKTNIKNNARFLVFSESRFPFWKAKINDQPAQIYTANYLFSAVLVHQGENEIEFIYPNLLEQSLVSAKFFLSKLIN